MPFTFSHAVAVLPLATGRPGRTLVPAALVIGSMIPDLPYFVAFLRHSDRTHAAYGPVTIDLALGLVVFAGWHLVLRRPLVDLAPHWLAARVPGPRPLSTTGWVWVALSVVIGSITHVAWDTFTHRGHWGMDHIAALRMLVGPLPAYKWLQFASGALGLVVLVGAWWLVLAVFVGAAAVTWLPSVVAGAGFAEPVLFALATRSIAAGAAAVVGVSLVWHVGRIRRTA